MNNICSDLRHHVSTELLYGITACCRTLNITMPSNNQYPILHKDMMEIISVWTANTQLYQRLIYMIFHQFHKSRKWLSTVVDKFLFDSLLFRSLLHLVKKNTQTIEVVLEPLPEE